LRALAFEQGNIGLEEFETLFGKHFRKWIHGIREGDLVSQSKKEKKKGFKQRESACGLQPLWKVWI
jgi:hypothetical protein